MRGANDLVLGLGPPDYHDSRLQLIENHIGRPGCLDVVGPQLMHDRPDLPHDVLNAEGPTDAGLKAQLVYPEEDLPGLTRCNNNVVQGDQQQAATVGRFASDDVLSKGADRHECPFWGLLVR